MRGEGEREREGEREGERERESLMIRAKYPSTSYNNHVICVQELILELSTTKAH